MRRASSLSADISDYGPDRSARMAGASLLLTAAATAVMVFTRVAADADQDTLLQSLRAVDENRAVYSSSGIARLLSGVAFFVAAWFLLQTWIIRDRWASPLVPYLFAISAVCTVLSGACAILIAAYPAPEITYANGVATGAVPQVVEVVSGLRWITGKIGFSAAGIALLVAARFQWQVGGTLKRIAPLSAVIGRRDAIHLGRCRDDYAPDCGNGFLPLAAGGGNDAVHRQSRKALCRAIQRRVHLAALPIPEKQDSKEAFNHDS